jgi:hypothetical protein
VLCDFAQIRETLLFISSGGISRVVRPELPAALHLMVGGLIEVEFGEIEQVHEIRVTVLNAEEGEVVAQVTGGLQAAATDLQPFESLYVPLSIDLRNAQVTRYGRHEVEIAVDGNRWDRSITFFVSDRLPSPR